MEQSIKVALAGNPNSGKSTIFNALTGAHQHVGNYPGVTVEKKEGYAHVNGRRLDIVDLPGTYALTALSEEEIVARNFILDHPDQIVVDIIDASNLERNLYLAVQLMELNAKVVLALNMHDIARQKGISIDIDRLSQLLGVPVVTTVGHKKRGIDGLKEAVLQLGEGKFDYRATTGSYGEDIENCVSQLEAQLASYDRFGRHKRWVALKLLENDAAVVDMLREHVPDQQFWSSVDRAREKLAQLYGDSADILIADRRYGFISGLVQEVTTVGVEQRHDLSDQIDAVLTHPVLGLPIFLGLMYLVFYLTFTVGEPLMGLIERGFSVLSVVVSGFWAGGVDSPLKSLLVDGLIGGVGGVIVFLPNILLLFLAIALLEDTGYMARAAFIMDRFMHKIGLHGKSFIPMLVGFGCSVPAIMATRILESRRDRFTTIMIIPLISCGARLPIYALLIPAFFPQHWRAPMLWIIYLIGVGLAVAAARILRTTVFRGESMGLVIELPPYRMPTIRGLLTHMWQRGWLYLRKAGTIILSISLILWALTSYPKPPEQRLAGIDQPEARQAVELSYSLAGRIGAAMEPALKPLGFDWKIGTALIGAIAAKEVFVAQMGIVFSVGEADEESPGLREKLAERYSPLTGFCIMLFCLIAAPCMATVAITRRETGSWGWAGAQFAGLTLLGYILTLITYQVGSLITALRLT